MTETTEWPIFGDNCKPSYKCTHKGCGRKFAKEPAFRLHQVGAGHRNASY